nr:MAG TPA: hypothetical protein [Caudoviricetes sp.]
MNGFQLTSLSLIVFYYLFIINRLFPLLCVIQCGS